MEKRKEVLMSESEQKIIDSSKYWNIYLGEKVSLKKLPPLSAYAAESLALRGEAVREEILDQKGNVTDILIFKPELVEKANRKKKILINIK